MRSPVSVTKLTGQTILIPQNLLDILIHLNPSVPTYIGEPVEHWEYQYNYMQGGLYGFSYGIIRTMESARPGEDQVTLDRPEDARIGHLMVKDLPL